LHLIAESVDEGNGGVVRDHLQTLSVSVVSAYSMSRDAVSSAAFARPSRMRGKGRSVQERLAAGWRRQDADEVDGVGHESSPRNESGSVQTSMQSALTDPRRIVAAEMYRINNRRYIAVADAAGKIAVVDVESRKIHSVFHAPDGVVAFRQSPHYVAWVGATAAGAADLSTLEIMRKPCANLNGTSIVKARFDVAASGRFVGTFIFIIVRATRLTSRVFCVQASASTANSSPVSSTWTNSERCAPFATCVKTCVYLRKCPSPRSKGTRSRRIRTR
jgi:hypothetical protein